MLFFSSQNLSDKEKECTKLQNDLASLGVAAKEGVEAAARVKALEKEVKGLNTENKTLTENYNSERVSTSLTHWPLGDLTTVSN